MAPSVVHSMVALPAIFWLVDLFQVEVKNLVQISTASKNLWNKRLMRLPCERALKTVSETGVKNDLFVWGHLLSKQTVMSLFIFSSHSNWPGQGYGPERTPRHLKNPQKRFGTLLFWTGEKIKLPYKGSLICHSDKSMIVHIQKRQKWVSCQTCVGWWCWGVFLVPVDDLVSKDGPEDGLDFEAGLNKATSCCYHGGCQRSCRFI